MHVKKAAAIVVAGGQGKRIGGTTCKQFIEISGKPILCHTLQKFQACKAVDEIITVVPGLDVDRVSSLCDSEWEILKPHKTIAGGEERNQSVWAGLQALSDDIEIVAIHDGVRPFILPEIITLLIAQAGQFGAVAIGVPPKDTIKEIERCLVQKTLPRESLIAIQTPQVFLRDLIVRAYEHAMVEGFVSTDDAALVERLGHQVRIVAGDYRNIKITSPEDLVIAEALMSQEQTG
jgi:2-C-methyl-D-erythritol 4-phosphate cytidylyltransferase